MRYEIVEYRPEFKSQVAQLRTHLQSADVELNAAYLDWKYERNPYVDRPFIYVTLGEGQVVGMRGMWGAKWQIGHPSQTFVCPCAGDLVIDPHHRNRGLFSKMTEAALNDLANKGYIYAFNLSAGPATHLGSLTTGWRGVGPLQTAHWLPRQGTISTRVRRLASRLPFASSAYRRVRRCMGRLLFDSSGETHYAFHFLDKNGARRVSAGKYVSIEQTPRPDAMAELVERIGNDGRIRHVRDQQYFAWRYQNPLSLYRFLFWEDTRMEGYLVLRTSVYTHGVGVSIVDWEATNALVQADLLHAAIRLANLEDLTIWSATLSDHAKTLLQNTGFNLLDETRSIGRAYRAGAYRPAILVRPVRDEMLKADWLLADRRLLDLGNWDLRMIYSDSH